MQRHGEENWPLHQILNPWVEQTKSISIAWELVRDNRYTGHYGGPKCGPLINIQDAVCQNNNIVDIFICFPMSLLSYIDYQTR